MSRGEGILQQMEYIAPCFSMESKYQQNNNLVVEIISDYSIKKGTQDALSDDQKLVQLLTEYRLYGHDGKSKYIVLCWGNDILTSRHITLSFRQHKSTMVVLIQTTCLELIHQFDTNHSTQFSNTKLQSNGVPFQQSQVSQQTKFVLGNQRNQELSNNTISDPFSATISHLSMNWNLQTMYLGYFY
ncbi:hypothetical protein BCR42DRAFT_449225 [Absidia repens]|uniref:Uncharacterized protein n=1 Tax=Absidia repens TaxID=90262 RepID=A0A1X2IN87_9FUNG|nr:hypothetical protein BCR42DRAFT_449225 [Absidia repens]